MTPSIERTVLSVRLRCKAAETMAWYGLPFSKVSVIFGHFLIASGLIARGTSAKWLRSRVNIIISPPDTATVRAPAPSGPNSYTFRVLLTVNVVCIA